MFFSHLHQVMKASNLESRIRFVNPCALSGKSKNGGSTKATLLASRLEVAMNDQLFFVPYNIGWVLILCILYVCIKINELVELIAVICDILKLFSYHWVLLVIHLSSMTIYYLDSLFHGQMDPNLRIIVNT